jgi:hypothetical protein
MWRAILSLALAIFFTALAISIASVYVFHDVDQGEVGRWSEALANLSLESVIFSLLISLPVWLLAGLGRYLLRLRGFAPRSTTAVFLGVALTVCQYPFELFGRKFAPDLRSGFLTGYMIAAVLFCTVALLRDAHRQKLAQSKFDPVTTNT